MIIRPYPAGLARPRPKKTRWPPGFVRPAVAAGVLTGLTGCVGDGERRIVVPERAPVAALFAITSHSVLTTVPVPAPSGGGNVLTHGLPWSVSLPGGGLGPKSGSGLILRDVQSDPVGTLSNQWSAHQPNSTYGPDAFYNLQNRAPNFQPSSYAIGVPNPYVGGTVAGAHYSLDPHNQGTAVSFTCTLGKNIAPIPAYPWCFYVSGYMRCDPGYGLDIDGAHGGLGNFAQGDSQYDYNAKGICYGDSFATPFAEIIVFDSPGPINNTIVNEQVHWLSNGAPAGRTGIAMQDPDKNGHSHYWLHQPSPWYPGNGWLYFEYRVCLDQRTFQTGGVGFAQWRVNGSKLVDYVGCTDSGTSSTTSRWISIGPSTVNRAYGLGYNNNTQAATNFDYMSDITIDVTGGNVAGGVARAVATDNAVYDSSTVFAYQTADSGWSDTGAGGTKFWKGGLLGGSQAWIHAFTEAGGEQVFGPYTVAVSP